jgi:cytochrome c oxidase subunit 2
VLYGTFAIIGSRAVAATLATADERVIRITARKFEFTPNQITLKLGQPVKIEFAAIDYIHGFSLPDLNIRADGLPGQIVEVRFTPQRAGDLPFLCDNFCGSGHEEMNGKFVVKA